jgi:hypothetical protein
MIDRPTPQKGRKRQRRAVCVPKWLVYIRLESAYTFVRSCLEFIRLEHWHFPLPMSPPHNIILFFGGGDGANNNTSLQSGYLLEFKCSSHRTFVLIGL